MEGIWKLIDVCSTKAGIFASNHNNWLHEYIYLMEKHSY